MQLTDATIMQSFRSNNAFVARCLIAFNSPSTDATFAKYLFVVGCDDDFNVVDIYVLLTNCLSEKYNVSFADEDTFIENIISFLTREEY